LPRIFASRYAGKVGNNSPVERRQGPHDFEEIRRQIGGRCFVCELLQGNPEFRHHVIYEDQIAIAFLNKYPNLYGYSLVAPKKHHEAVTGDFEPTEYLALQEVIYRVGEAVRCTVPTERLYVLSLGSQQGNRHVHWHIAPLPPGVPFEKQQLTWLDRPVRVTLTDEEMADLARRIGEAMEDSR
jgi:diadenosine tetraphosphate (Ap4A) HIT family hydrolase